ncbi:anthranilate synthase component I family protein [Desulfobotulus sp.]|jgi:anthranilate synthase component 1|uniref:anthranilate synthase component I family protein n=1 Tax=Desulfobotulus sp. TaxID=1940337 RepID=UPI002A35C5EE|nr:anthranilate synthase component I family protein [Desulfobotulus sp.]MDY0161711.1 anthranilate synthase component I family protein [Desulfobotulus sp.]
MLLDRFPAKNLFQEKAREGCNVIPLCARILADSETPVSMLRRFHNSQDPIFLFESVEGGERWARYSFLGTSFRSEIRIYTDRVEKRGPGATEILPHDGDFTPALREILSRYRLAELADLPPFPGGLVGYLAYEAVSCFEAIPHSLPASRPLGVFLIPDTLMVFDNHRHTLTCICLAFLEDGASAESAYSTAEARLEALLETVRKPAPEERIFQGPAPVLEPMTSPEVFRDRVKKVKEHILEGDIIQAVISQSFEGPAPDDPVALYRAVRYTNPSPYLFFLRAGGQTLVGSSPETMVRLEDGLATLRPIAGTRPRGANPAEDRRFADDLLKDEKEKAEHLMLVDLGRNDLGRIARTGSVQVTDLMMVERYSHVMHLVSNITAQMKPGVDALDLVAATFPAGTLSGAPKIRAMEIIAENEDQPRDAYGGAVGYFSFSGNMDLAIVIRTATIRGERLCIRAGAGIVADSDPETERQETLNKAKALQTALAMLAGPQTR